jgi:hypothetical protein
MSPTGFTVRHTAGPLGVGVHCGIGPRAFQCFRCPDRNSSICHKLVQLQYDWWLNTHEFLPVKPRCRSGVAGWLPCRSGSASAPKAVNTACETQLNPVRVAEESQE